MQRAEDCPNSVVELGTQRFFPIDFFLSIYWHGDRASDGNGCDFIRHESILRYDRFSVPREASIVEKLIVIARSLS